MLLGNDVVDRREAAALNKDLDPRFLNRVFTSQERDCIQGSFEPSLVLWLLWTAKESLFKIEKKREPGTVFAHAAFSIEEPTLSVLKTANRLAGFFSAKAIHRCQETQLHWEWSEEYIHCTAICGDCPSWVRKVEVIGKNHSTLSLSPREEESAHSPASRQARLLAREILRDQFALNSAEIIRPWGAGSLFLPPVIQEGGHPSPGLDLSLSHDGRYVAALVGRA